MWWKKNWFFREKICQIEGADATESVNFSDLCVYMNQKVPTKFEIPDLQKYDGKSYPIAPSISTV